MWKRRAYSIKLFTQKRNSVNLVKDAEMGVDIKSAQISISGKFFSPIYDSGSEDNYVTQSVLEQLGKMAFKLENSIKRFTCLGDMFVVKEQVELNFDHSARNYTKVFKVLPRWKDACIILGR